mmetsp:Transcript_1918/g.3882  ORF Transcript_1918/g.3882 Transcript_1918/m.3882 type:complete len:245 (-) Transcript_1918:557-1291(-)
MSASSPSLGHPRDRRHSAACRSSAAICMATRLISSCSRALSSAARSTGSASCLCALFSMSNASFARACAHLSGWTRSESRQYAFLIVALSVSGSTPSTSYASALCALRMRMHSASRCTPVVALSSSMRAGGGGPIMGPPSSSSLSSSLAWAADTAAAASRTSGGGMAGPTARLTGGPATGGDSGEGSSATSVASVVMPSIEDVASGHSFVGSVSKSNDSSAFGGFASCSLCSSSLLPPSLDAAN